ncbi:methyl-accepting chemotaxis protein [Proteocatella sphenisci]|uniref:methyl-accepting chemotaxis protein n=1 Tax=Proteocatella sphenisci TaxID=181070 RepID=UPI0004B95BF2|nr:methyl-accepting chemotaxis protein [Proteocatella sphenisci]
MKRIGIFKKTDFNNGKSTSIKKRITNAITAIIIVLSIVLGGLAGYLSYSSSMEALEISMKETAEIASTQISTQLKSYKDIAYEIGSIAKLSNPDISLSEKQSIIDSRLSSYGFIRGNIMLTNGTSIFDGNDYSDREYFQASIKGDSFVSEPLISKVTGKLTTIISSPLWKNGISGSEIVGVIYLVPDENFLNDTVREIKIGDSGSAYMLNNSGTTIASAYPENVGIENTIEASKSDSSLNKLAEIQKKMIQGLSGFGKSTYAGEIELSGYAPVPNTDGWSIAVTAKQSEFMGGVSKAILYVIASIIVFVALGIIIARKFANSISLPVIECAKRLKMLSEGDLNSPVPVTDAKDETGDLLRDLKTTVETLSASISEVSFNLIEMADGNLNVHMSGQYMGDLEPLSRSVSTINTNLNEIMGEITMSADQVSNGSDQVSAGAQVLAQGSTEQSSSVEQIVATVEEVSSLIQKSSVNASDASNKAEEVGKDVDICNQEMQRMMQAMTEINASSSEIGKIIKTIEDIAFQTNILALNAAVEAARAGSAGKGFAVVADEVRNLATKSAEAARNTTVLIENSITAVENGSSIANRTAKIMQDVTEHTKMIVEAIHEISSDSAEQSSAIVELEQGIDQISSVVHSNSATAEQSAASSEELSAQADSLKSLVSKFQLAD